MPFRIGPMELVLILAVVMIIFGVGRLPEVFGSFGKGIREFRKAASGEEEPSAAGTGERSAASTASNAASTSERPKS
ncbi:MAG: twin-arginine translocase TatA/TatE family subunit [Chloroflexota bacterium]|nr:twin-arginine translocase TatA/TatE family subunit [Dehalococcoidia bacterium]MDW8252867.1 twin-arginine translocase TatA/TatE family subunit [Chloroflexota bacterium]